MEGGKESKVVLKKQLQVCWNWLGINRINDSKKDRSINASIVEHFAPACIETIPKLTRKRDLLEQSINVLSHSEKAKEEAKPNVKKIKPILKLGGGNMFILPDFADDIDSYLRWLEDKNSLSMGFLTNSFQCNGLHSGMRQMLVNWMFQLRRTFSLVSETISLAVFILDRALIQMAKSITKNNLQLLGAACLLIACKFEEIVVPNVSDLAYMAENMFTKNQILRMELSVLKALDYNLNYAHSIQFLRRYRYSMQIPKQLNNLAKFISEVALIAYPLAHYKSSVVAAISLYLSAVVHNFSIPSTVFSDFLHQDERTVISVACKFVPYVLDMAAPNKNFHALYDNFKKDAELPLTGDQISQLEQLLD